MIQNLFELEFKQGFVKATILKWSCPLTSIRTESFDCTKLTISLGINSTLQ